MTIPTQHHLESKSPNFSQVLVLHQHPDHEKELWSQQYQPSSLLSSQLILAISSWRTLSSWEGTKGCWTKSALGSWWCQGCWLELLWVVRDNTTPQPAARSLFASRTATFYLEKLDMQKWFPAYRCAMVCLLKAAASANILLTCLSYSALN